MMNRIVTAVGLGFVVGIIGWQTADVSDAALFSIAFLLFVAVLELTEVNARLKKLADD